MKKCPYCGHSNYAEAAVCRKCDAAFYPRAGTVYRGRTYWMGPARARVLRHRALFLVVLGLLMKLYWGGYGPWPPIDFPILATVRTYLEPILLYCGAVLYIFGWIAAFV